MTDRSTHQTLLKLRFAVGLLGEKAENGWWQTSFLEPSSRAFLDPVFVRTGLLAQLHGVTEAARRVHDARLAAGSFHLFRLPEEVEQDLHALVIELSRRAEPLMPSDAAAAMVMLDELAAGDGTDVPGPKRMGEWAMPSGDLTWRQVAAVYRDAFRKGFQSYPFFARA